MIVSFKLRCSLQGVGYKSTSQEEEGARAFARVREQGIAADAAKLGMQ